MASAVPLYDRLSERNIMGIYYEILESTFAQGWSSKLATLIPSDQKAEDHAWLGMVPALREWIGGRQAKSLREDHFEIKNVHYEASIAMPISSLRRDKTGQVELRLGEMADRAAQHWDKLTYTLLANGETGDCYDGKSSSRRTTRKDRPVRRRTC